MIALGCDHGGYELKLEIRKYLDEKGIEYKDYGCDSTASVDYPVYATVRKPWTIPFTASWLAMQ